VAIVPNWIDLVHETWESKPLPATINLRSRPQLVNAATELRAQEWRATAKGQGLLREFSAELFVDVIQLLVSSGGDPPASAEQRALARAIARSQAPDDVIERTDALARLLMPNLDGLLARCTDDVERTGLRVILAGVVAMLSLPRVDVLRLRMELPPVVPGEPDVFGETLQTAFDCPVNEPDRRQVLMCAALDVAASVKGPPPAAVPVLEALVYGGHPLAPETLRRCVAAMTAMKTAAPYTAGDMPAETARARTDSQASLYGIIAIRVREAGLADELTEAIADAVEGMLVRDLSPRARLSAGLNAARLWIQADMLDRGSAIIKGLADANPGPAADLRAAELEAEIRSRSGDSEGATEILHTALERDITYRRSAVLALISNWPVYVEPNTSIPRPAREGVERWIDEAERLVEAASSSDQTPWRDFLKIALIKIGFYQRAADIGYGTGIISEANGKIDPTAVSPQLEEKPVLDPVITVSSAEIERMYASLTRIEQNLNRVTDDTAQTAKYMRRIMQISTTEVSDCPSVFTLIPERPKGLRKFRFHQHHYRLTLWCQDSPKWHPWPRASYELDPPKEWFTEISPYAALVLRTLQLVLPVAGSAADILLSSDQFAHARDDLKLMNALVHDLPGKLSDEQIEIGLGEATGRLTAAQGQALRAIRTVLFEHDRLRSFGGLNRVARPSGEFVWICPEHYPEHTSQ
jgi:hypothetical protein